MKGRDPRTVWPVKVWRGGEGGGVVPGAQCGAWGGREMSSQIYKWGKTVQAMLRILTFIRRDGKL